jgi:glyceraldehyde-3-phosphate dehydrogenase (NAD(P))
VNTIFPDLDIDTLGLKVPATLMHMHSVNVTLESEPDADEVREVLAGQSRIMVLDEDLDIEGTGPLKEYANDMGRPRGDLWENCLWGESVTTVGRDFYCFQAIHQESDVVPENVDAIRAITGAMDAEESVATTNDALGL